jgi:hypothetical protein
MVTRDHLIFDLLEVARAGRGSDDESLTPELVGFWIDNTRAELIGQWIDKGRSINPDLIQILPCMAVSQVDASECGCVLTDCYLFRTDERIPDTVESANGMNLITRVGPVMVTSRAFSFVPYERAIVSGDNKFTKNTAKAFLRNGYIYIISNKYIGKKISVSLVASYPMDLADYATCTGTPCYTNESKYPISARMIETLKKKILDADLKIALTTKGDDINNANNIV